MNCPQAILAYVPVLHRGYMKLFQRYAGSNLSLAILDDWFMNIDVLSYFRKDIRRLDVGVVADLVRGLNMFRNVIVLWQAQEFLAFNPATIIVCEDHVTRVLEETYPQWFLGRTVIRESSFLMWDRMSAKVPLVIQPDRTMSIEDFGGIFVSRVRAEAASSSDWWRRVGAMVIRDGTVLQVAHNAHLPTEYQPYVVGDARGSFHKGADLDMTSAIHAEQAVIVAAARQGLALEGADMLVTTFPCSPCAKSLALAGIRRLYFLEGYSILDAQDVLRAAGVEIILVQ